MDRLKKKKKEDSPEIVQPKVDVTIDDTAADDRIKGENGDDRINGKEGYDVLFGDPRENRIDSGPE